jgi:hypothetical protein
MRWLEMSALRLKLADGTEVEGTIEGAISGQLRDLLATGYAGNKMRISADDSADVEGHGLSTTVNLRLFDEDDVEGHALSLRLPNAEAARDLQRKLLATGVAGLIVVGAVTTAVVGPELLKSVDTSGAPAVGAPAVTRTITGDEAAGAGRYQVSTGYGQSAVPAAAQGVFPGTTTPGYGQSQVPPAAQGVYPEASTSESTGISPALAAEIAGGEAEGTGYGQSQVPPAAQGVYPEASTSESTGISPALAAEIAGGEAEGTGYGQSQVPPAAQGIYPEASGADATDDPADDMVGRPGEPRAQ